jgi:hypothetical protein
MDGSVKDSGMTRITVDSGRCEDHGPCEQTAPEVCRLDAGRVAPDR